jgi:nucleoprotein TPR
MINIVQIAALEDAIRGHRDVANKNTAGFKSRLGQLNNEKSQMTATITELRNQIKTLTAEGSQAAAVNDEAQSLKQQLENLRREKEGVEKQLAEEKASKSSLPQTPEHESVIVSGQTKLIFFCCSNVFQAALKEERDKLLAEKASWSTNTAATAADDHSTTDEARRLWEAAKAELTKARDEALSRADATDKAAKKVAEEAKNVRFSNVRVVGL